MSQLSEVASVSRKVIKYGAISLVIMIVGRGILGVTYKWWKATHPDPPPPPDVKFGKLSQLQFPKQVVDTTKFHYSLETPTGNLPTKLPKQYKVYFMPIKKPSLLAYDQAKQLAESLGFIREPKKLSESRYRWSENLDVPTTLTMNIITGEFRFEKKWRNDDSYLTPTYFISKERAINLVKNQLSRLNLLPTDLESGENKISYWKVQNDKLVPAVALSKSQFLKIDLFRAPLDETPVLTIGPDKGLVTAVLGLQKNEKKQIVELTYKYFPVDQSQFATYPLIGVQTAWQRLQKGQAYFAQIPPANKTEVGIEDIYLAYYDAETPQQFMQPVYVFEGKDFRAYVPAVADEWVEEK